MKLRSIILAGVLCASSAAAILAEPIRIVEKLPRTEQLESGELSLQKISDRQLVALMVDLVKRAEYDRSQHGGKAGPDGAYLKTWLDRVHAEMDTRKMSADPDGLIDLPADR